MNFAKYKPLNAFYEVIDNNNNLYYVSMNCEEANKMRDFYSAMGKESGLKFETLQIHKNSRVKIDGRTNPYELNLKINSSIINSNEHEQRLL